MINPDNPEDEMRRKTKTKSFLFLCRWLWNQAVSGGRILKKSGDESQRSQEKNEQPNSHSSDWALRFNGILKSYGKRKILIFLSYTTGNNVKWETATQAVLKHESKEKDIVMNLGNV